MGIKVNEAMKRVRYYVIISCSFNLKIKKFNLKFRQKCQNFNSLSFI